MISRRRLIILSCLAVILIICITLFRQNNGSSQKIIKVAPRASNRFKWSYVLYIPDNISRRYMLIVPNNTGSVDDNIEIHEKKAYSLLEWQKEYADKLGVPLLIPVFPRPEKIGHIYTHALDRDCIITDIEGIKRLDFQLIAMIEDAKERLVQRNIEVEEKVLLSGFSASGMFVNRFTILHPDRVKAAAVGSPGGWPIAPIKEYDNQKLLYPLGIGDIKELTGEDINMDEFRRVPQFFYSGDKDTNDASETCYYEDMEITANIFGNNPAQRWPVSEKIYKQSGCSARFSIYKNVEHTVTDEMEEDILGFLRENSR